MSKFQPLDPLDPQTQPDLQLPVLVQAWSDALNSKDRAEMPIHLKRYLDADPVTQKEIMREIYMFLHAQQLVSLTSKMEDVARSQRSIHRHIKSQKQSPRVRWWEIGWASVLGLSLSGVALAMSGFVLWQTQRH